MIINGFQKLTLLDYPGKMACIIFTGGCNYNCAYCHNRELLNCSNNELINEQEILDYLKKRKNILDGIVISGGEPTIQKDLVSFCKKVKKLGVLIKLDTNGSNPKVIKELLDNNLIDYIAMDIKDSYSKYEDIIKLKPNIDNLKESIELIKNSNIDHEFRTTVNKNNHTFKDLEEICSYIENDNYYLQVFKQNEYVLDKDLESYSKEEMKDIFQKLKEKYPQINIRGI